MKVLITGANGFIGKYVTKQVAQGKNKLLATGFKKTETDFQKENVKWLYGNLANLEDYKNKVKIFNPDIVVHMAWQGIPNYSENISRLNLDNSLNLIDFVIEETDCKRIIVSGSCFEYGKKSGSVKETDETTINSFFSWAKHSLYKYMKVKCAQKGVQLVWFRYFYVFGPGQRKESLIPTIIYSFQNRKPLNIQNPYNRNDFIFVQDIALAINCVINHESEIESGIFNLGSGYSTSVYEICEKIEQAFTGNKKVSKTLLNSPKGEYLDFWADISKIKNLGWYPKYSIDFGIKEMIENLK